MLARVTGLLENRMIALLMENRLNVVRRVTPSFSIPPPAVSEVMQGSSLSLNCVAVGAPMPYVKWRKDPATDLTPDDKLPVGKNVLMLTDIQESANYTCTAASDLGVIEATSMVKVQCSYRDGSN